MLLFFCARKNFCASTRTDEMRDDSHSCRFLDFFFCFFYFFLYISAGIVSVICSALSLSLSFLYTQCELYISKEVAQKIYVGLKDASVVLLIPSVHLDSEFNVDNDKRESCGSWVERYGGVCGNNRKTTKTHSTAAFI